MQIKIKAAMKATAAAHPVGISLHKNILPHLPTAIPAIAPALREELAQGETERITDKEFGE